MGRVRFVAALLVAFAAGRKLDAKFDSRANALRSVRGGSGAAEDSGLSFEATQPPPQKVKQPDAAAAHARLEAAWETVLQGGAPAGGHNESEARFFDELVALRKGRAPAEKALLQRGCAASLVGSARVAFSRPALEKQLGGLPRVSRGLRLVAKQRPPAAVHQSLALALAKATDARAVVLDEACLWRVRRLASAGDAGPANMPTREEVVTALFAAAANAGTPLVVYVRDGGSSVLRSKGACRAVSAELARDDSRVLLVVSNYADEAAPAADEPADGDESTWAAGVDVDAAEAAAVERVRGTAGDAAPVADEPSLMFERILFDLARNVVSHARQAAEAADLDVNEARYLDSVGEALEDEGVVRAVAEKCARLLQDPSVKLHFKLTVAPQPAAPGAAASALRETLADQGEARKQRSDRARPDLGAKATASLLQWIGLGGDAGASSAGGDERSREAASLLAALDDVAVEVPKGTDARLDWERWAAEDAKGAAWAHNSAALTKALDKAGLSCDGWAQLEAPFGRDAARRLSAEEAAQVVLQAFKVELATAELATAELVTGGPFAGRVSVAALAAALRPGAVRPAGDAATLAAGKHEKALVQHVVQPSDVSVTFDSIGGLDQAKAALREAITFPLKYPELYAEGVAAGAVKGVLLFGPPGTGKTLLAKAVATEGGAAFLAVDASTIEDKWLGESEKNAKAVFALARRLAPCVIFIDEIDSLLASRESGDDTAHGTLTSVKTTLMQEWDGLRTSGERVVVIGSTNRPFDLDEAVLRRMPRRILVDLPDAATREAILGVALRGNRLAPDVNLTAVAQKLGGYSGSDVYEICREAAMRVAHAEANALEARAELSGDAGGGRVASSAGAGHRLRPLCQADLLAAVGKLSASVAEHGPEMARVLEWNDQYGEVKKKDRAKRPAASLYL